MFEVDYFFEEVQNLMFAVYDLDNNTPKLTDDDFLGQLTCTLGQVRKRLRAMIVNDLLPVSIKFVHCQCQLRIGTLLLAMKENQHNIDNATGTDLNVLSISIRPLPTF